MHRLLTLLTLAACGSAPAPAPAPPTFDLTSTCATAPPADPRSLRAALTWDDAGLLDGLDDATAAALGPVCDGAMQDAFARGRALAGLLSPGPAPDATGEVVAPPSVAVVIDLPGAEAVAFAAGLAFSPRLVLGSPPRPGGIVRSHRTLGALLQHREALATAADGRTAWVLDADRGLPPPPGVADNRAPAHLPDAQPARTVLLVRPRADDAALPDVAPTLARWQAAGADVRRVAAQSFQPDRSPDSPLPTQWWYGGNPGTHWWFWVDYGLGPPPHDAIPPRDAPPR